LLWKGLEPLGMDRAGFNEAGLDFRPTSGFKVLRGPTRVEDIVRWGVWLGRHI